MKIGMPWIMIAMTAGICGAAEPRMDAGNHREVFIMNGERLATAKTAIANRDPEMTHALSRLIGEAESALDDGPFTVIHKTRSPPSGDKHDYMSFGPYWWPDPSTKDGLPYIRRDGQTNPSSKTNGSDSPTMHRMVRAVDTLALAYYFTGSEKYAASAALLLRTWFLSPETQMNPHLKYGQAIPGRVAGRGIGIIDTSILPKVVDSAGLLAGSDSWTDTDHQALKKWFRAYLVWLQTSKHGREERRAENNHGTWYDVQVACFALFVGDRETATKILQSAGEERISRQIRPDGRQERELARTNSFGYSIYNLNAMFCLARLGEHVGVDLWHYQVEDKTAIRAALNYLVPYAGAQEEWPHQQISELRRASLLPLLRQGLLVYNDFEYMKAIRGFSDKERSEDRSQLLYPITTTQPSPPGDVLKAAPEE